MATPAQYRGLQTMTVCVHMLGVTVLSYCLAKRIPPLSNWRQWRYLTWGRLCVILVLFDSWLFVFSSGILANGLGLTWSPRNCASAAVICISFYGLSKVLICAFLSERVYIVWSGGNQVPRLKSKSYRICGVVLTGYIAMLVIMVLGREGRLRDDGVCIIGLRTYAGISMIAYDLFLNVFLTAMFLWPLLRSNHLSPKLKAVAIRTLYGACISLITSAVNIAIVTGLTGNELGWICLSSCVSDVCLNAIALFWVSSNSHSTSSDAVRDRYSLPNLDMTAFTMTQDEPHRRITRVDGMTLTSILQTTPSSLIPESFYDYIPREHRTCGDVEKQEEAQHTRYVMSLSPTHASSFNSYTREDLEEGPSQPASPDALLTRFPQCSSEKDQAGSPDDGRRGSLKQQRHPPQVEDEEKRPTESEKHSEQEQAMVAEEKDICD